MLFAKSIALEMVEDDNLVVYLPEELGGFHGDDLRTFLIGLEATSLYVKAELTTRQYLIAATNSEEIE